MGYEGLPFKDIDKSQIPTDREYRNAWELAVSSITISEIKKLEIDKRKEKTRLIAERDAERDAELDEQVEINLGIK
jgi:hypothetical protein